MKSSSYENMNELREAILLLCKDYDPKDQAAACVSVTAHVADDLGLERALFVAGILACPSVEEFHEETARVYAKYELPEREPS